MNCLQASPARRGSHADSGLAVFVLGNSIINIFPDSEVTMEKITHFSAFAGIGGACSALREAGIPYTTTGISEIDKGALRLRKAILKDNPLNIGDINNSSWGNVESPYLYTGGFPCQPFSVMGLMRGFNDPRIKAMYSMRDMIMDILPNYILLENVKGVLTKTQRPHLMRWLEGFETEYSFKIHKSNPNSLGYIQSRGRVYITLSRLDMTPWVVPTLPIVHSPPQTWADIVDPILDPTSFYIMSAKNPRFKNSHIVVDTDTKIQCITHRGFQAYCGRMTYVPHPQGKVRSFSWDEHFRVFGYSEFPQIKSTRALSRRVQTEGFGNSWHVGHAGLILQTLPLPKGVRI